MRRILIISLWFTITFWATCVFAQSSNSSSTSGTLTASEIEAAVKAGMKVLPLILADQPGGEREPEKKPGQYFLVKPQTVKPITLRESYEGEGYSPVRPYEYWDELGKRLSTPEYNTAPLLDQIMKINTVPNDITIPSHPIMGFEIDRKNVISTFFEQHHDQYGVPGWKKLFETYPDVVGYLSVSLPAVDLENGYALVFVRYSWGWLAMRSWLILYKIDGDKIIELRREKLWMS